MIYRFDQFEVDDREFRLREGGRDKFGPRIRRKRQRLPSNGSIHVPTSY